jgi:hypothetical protein
VGGQKPKGDEDHEQNSIIKQHVLNGRPTASALLPDLRHHPAVAHPALQVAEKLKLRS